MENIEFHTSLLRYHAADLTLTYAASVDGMPVCYAVTAGAPEERFGAHSWRQGDPLQTMESHHGTIEGVARSLFELTDSHNIVLRSGHFRFGMQPSREQHGRRLRLRWI